MDIVEFLTARLDEDEQLAKHAAHLAREGGAHWAVGATRYVEDYAFVSITTAPPNVVEVAGSGFDGTGGVHGLVYAEHIARHDPARVLAEVKAKRKLVDGYPKLARRIAEIRAREPMTYSYEQPKYAGMREALEAVLITLAAPYADHPDFDPAWRVDQ
jgi:hypothetical protein